MTIGALRLMTAYPTMTAPTPKGPNMTSTATASTAAEPTNVPEARDVVGPPGFLFCAVTFGAILLALDTNSRASLGGLVQTALLWLLIAVVWLLRLALALWQARGRMSAAHWARWLAIPLVLGVIFGITSTDVVKRTRFDLSRGALDQMAVDVMAGGSLDRGWVGLYDVGIAERTANGVAVVIDDSGFGRWGFAFSADGEPRESEDNYSGLWTSAEYEQLDGNWWVFSQGWD
jgi:hypothetical protein